MEKLLSAALKINLPVTLAVGLVFYVLKPVLSNIDFISANPILVFVILIIVINFGIITIFLVTKKPKNTVSENEIKGNKVKKDLKITGHSVRKNTVENNEVSGSLTIGQEIEPDRKLNDR